MPIPNINEYEHHFAKHEKTTDISFMTRHEPYHKQQISFCCWVSFVVFDYIMMAYLDWQ